MAEKKMATTEIIFKKKQVSMATVLYCDRGRDFKEKQTIRFLTANGNSVKRERNAHTHQSAARGVVTPWITPTAVRGRQRARKCAKKKQNKKQTNKKNKRKTAQQKKK